MDTFYLGYHILDSDHRITGHSYESLEAAMDSLGHHEQGSYIVDSFGNPIELNAELDEPDELHEHYRSDESYSHLMSILNANAQDRRDQPDFISREY